MIDYYTYIKSPEWYKKTEEVRKRNGGFCEICHVRYGSEVHHITYERLGEELPEDLKHLCWSCHGYIHREKHGHIFNSEMIMPILNEYRELADKIKQKGNNDSSN